MFSQVALASSWVGTALIPFTDGAGPMFIPAGMLLELVDDAFAVDVPLLAEQPVLSRPTAAITAAPASARRAAPRRRLVLVDSDICCSSSRWKIDVVGICVMSAL
jgi:hypothetical protein